jgi:hypothetical protein
MTSDLGLQAEDSPRRFRIEVRKTWPAAQHSRLHWLTAARRGGQL